ncbi:Uncharacterised protein [Mycobacteroides abscessus subsp. abscessus]|nr:Uncharacterised protein [Mycobacteroides abscessus subsp. abscessus]SHR05598.1 Uncharacterised protein [Mycobacteroides abscessus subsp. abscessus]SHR23039.1 Uncharacterised protein [Mycobacteroides abscessus subsp. abscessus]SHR40574.1 Uncharacterised protein [Mycobacteroides abscessus subsp. abscessus]SHR51076.1 Uncharacterised protein [Mycobacteroides abscessus subsp. abscessus]
MGTVQFDRVEPGGLGVAGGLRVLPRKRGELTGLQRAPAGRRVTGQTRRAHRLHPGVELRIDTALHTLMPELCGDHRSLPMHRIGDGRPPRQRISTGQPRHIRLPTGGIMRDEDALGDDEADTTSRATPIVGGHILSRHTTGRGRPRHRRHRESVGRCHRFDSEGLEKGRYVWSHVGHEVSNYAVTASIPDNVVNHVTKPQAPARVPGDRQRGPVVEHGMRRVPGQTHGVIPRPRFDHCDTSRRRA